MLATLFVPLMLMTLSSVTTGQAARAVADPLVIATASAGVARAEGAAATRNAATSSVVSSAEAGVGAVLASLARPAWEAGGMPADRADLLEAEAARVIDAVLSATPDAFFAYADERGLTLDTIASAYVRQLARGPYKAFTPEQRGGTLREQLRFAWDHPDERRARWQTIDLSSVSGSVGFALNVAETSAGGSGMWTMLEWPGRLEHFAAAGDVPPLGGNISFRAVLSGREHTIRVGFVWDGVAGCWRPATLYAVGGDRSKHPRFMF